MSSNNNSFTIRDNNSQILSILPKEWVEPLVIIAKVEGFDGIDSYVLHMIKDRLSMFVDTRDELGESFKRYMQNIEGLEDLSPAATEGSEENEEEQSIKEENTKKFINDVNEKFYEMTKAEDKEKEDLK
jgi:hypothetical protein